MNIWQLLKEQKLLLSSWIQCNNFNYLIHLYPSAMNGSLLLRVLILKLWLPGGQDANIFMILTTWLHAKYYSKNSGVHMIRERNL